jgi:nucleotide-binding universal stress UspA family protein
MRSSEKEVNKKKLPSLVFHSTKMISSSESKKAMTLLFALDESAGSKHAMEWALDNLIQPKTHKIVLMTVVEAIPDAAVYSGSGFDDLAMYTAKEDVEEAKEKSLNEAAVFLKKYEKKVRDKYAAMVRNICDLHTFITYICLFVCS